MPISNMECPAELTPGDLELYPERRASAKASCQSSVSIVKRVPYARKDIGIVVREIAASVASRQC